MGGTFSWVLGGGGEVGRREKGKRGGGGMGRGKGRGKERGVLLVGNGRSMKMEDGGGGMSSRV
jgi:hypothetical protein